MRRLKKKKERRTCWSTWRELHQLPASGLWCGNVHFLYCRRFFTSSFSIVESLLWRLGVCCHNHQLYRPKLKLAPRTGLYAEKGRLPPLLFTQWLFLLLVELAVIRLSAASLGWWNVCGGFIRIMIFGRCRGEESERVVCCHWIWLDIVCVCVRVWKW